jgi:hypothetical protein
VKVLLVRPGPHFSVADVHNGWRDAFRDAGCQVVDFNLDDRLNFYTQALLEKDGITQKAFSEEAAVRLAADGLKNVIYDFWPDLVLVTSGFFLPPDLYPTIRARGHKLAALFTESPYEDDKQLERAGFFDLVMVNDPVNLEQFRGVNPASFYVPHAYRPALHRPGMFDPDLACDLSFVGTCYPSRAQFFKTADLEGLNVRFAGNFQQWKDDRWFTDKLVHPVDFCCDNTDTVRLYQSSKASLNLYRKEASSPGLVDGIAMGPREVELAATGTFFLREHRPESDEVLWMLPGFDEPGEVRPLLDWWLRNDSARQDAARAARQAVEERTFDRNVQLLLQRLGF